MSWQHSLWRTVARVRGALGGGPPPGLRALTYHSVGTTPAFDPYGTAMATGLFEAHLDLVVSLKARLAPAALERPADPAPRIALTFDDGYRDTLLTAAPLLVARGLPFTVFVPPGHLDDVAGLYLTKAQVRELAALPGARIGAHGGRHVPLPALSDAELARELTDSRARLSDLLGRPVTAMSYPYGRLDRRVRDAASAAGFTLAATSRYGTTLPDDDPLLLRRTEAVAWDTVDDLRLKLTGAWDLFALRQDGFG